MTKQAEKSRDDVRSVLMDRAVSRAMYGLDTTPALQLLVRARKLRRNHVRARVNAILDGPAGPDLQHSGDSTARGLVHLLRDALAAEGLPQHLRDQLRSVLGLSRAGGGRFAADP